MYKVLLFFFMIFVCSASFATNEYSVLYRDMESELQDKYRKFFDNEYLDMYYKIAQLSEEYVAASFREHSAANKVLTAATMAATGIGGMQLASGLAEQAADEDAEQAMHAYLATFTCELGNQTVAGGTQNVEIPGGNELVGLYSEYVNLANDLKSRKAALGLKPGIESETILDGATSGMYDDVSVGKTRGAYASLARALTDPNSEDAKIWAAQKEETAEKVKTGGTVGGVGAGAGAIGNLIINKGK